MQNLLLNLDLTRYQVDLFVGLCPPDQASCAPALEAAGVHIIAVPDNKKARIRALYQHLKTHKDCLLYTSCFKEHVPAVQTLHNFRIFCPNGILMRDGHVCEECPQHGLGLSLIHI